MSEIIEDILRNLLHPSLSFRKKGFTQFKEIFSNAYNNNESQFDWKALREYLWKAIEFEDDMKNQAELIEFSITVMGRNSINKLIRINENGKIQENGLKRLVDGFIQFSSSDNYNALRKSLIRGNFNTYDFVRKIFSSKLILDYLFKFTPFLEDLLKYEDFKFQRELINQLLNDEGKQIEDLDFDGSLLEFHHNKNNPEIVMLTNSPIGGNIIETSSTVELTYKTNQIFHSISKSNKLSSWLLEDDNIILHAFSNSIIYALYDTFLEENNSTIEIDTSIFTKELLANLLNSKKISDFKTKIVYSWLIIRCDSKPDHILTLLNSLNPNYLTLGHKIEGNTLSIIDRFVLDSASSNNKKVRSSLLEIIRKNIMNLSSIGIIEKYNIQEREVIYDLDKKMIDQNLLFKSLKSRNLDLFELTEEINQLIEKGNILYQDLLNSLNQFISNNINVNKFLDFTSVFIYYLLLLILMTNDPHANNRSVCYEIANSRKYWVSDKEKLLLPKNYLVDFLVQAVTALLFDKNHSVKLSSHKYIQNMIIWLVEISEFEDILNQMRENQRIKRYLVFDSFKLDYPFTYFLLNYNLLDRLGFSEIFKSVEHLGSVESKGLIDYVFNQPRLRFWMLDEITTNEHKLLENLMLGEIDSLLSNKIGTSTDDLLEAIKNILLKLIKRENVEIRSKAHFLLNKIR